MNVSAAPGQPHATEVTRLRAHLRALVRRFSVAERADVECCGMTVAQAAAVEALRGGPLRFGELGRRLGVAPSTLTRNVRRLEEVGLVARENDSRDGRASRVQLTTQGEGTAARLEEIEERFAAAVLGRLPEARRGAGSRFVRRAAGGGSRGDRGVLRGRLRPSPGWGTELLRNGNGRERVRR